MAKDQLPESYTVREFSELAGIHENTTRRWLAKGIIRAYKFGGQWRIPKGALDEMMVRQSNIKD